MRRVETWPWVLLALCCALGGVALVALCIEAPLGSGAQEHPLHDGILRGGEAPDTATPLWWLAWLFGALSIALFTTLLLRASTRRGFGASAWGLVASMFVIQAAFAGVVLSYRQSAGASGGAETWGPFPAPTTWMLLVFYPSQLLLVVHFVVRFRRSFWTADDQARFEDLVGEERAEASR